MGAKKDELAAIITIKRPGKMTAKGRKDIAAWLRRAASDLLKYGKVYSDTRFTARYMYRQ